MCSVSHVTNEARELLEWELSLDSRDIRAHAWYHGAINRPRAEAILDSDGDFLVRDCSSGKFGDFVLSCRWENANLHFLIHKDIFQKDTIYEQLRFRFESDSFDTVPDLITYHVGSGIPISVGSGALITNPRNRTTPLLKPIQKNLMLDGVRSDYVSICHGEVEPEAAFTVVERVSTLERLKQKSLNLNPPPGLLEELENIPPELAAKLNSGHEKDSYQAKDGQLSHFDLKSFGSILLPTTAQDVRLDRELFKTIIARLVESSDRSAALHITKLDFDHMNGDINVNDQSEDSLPRTTDTKKKNQLYNNFFQNSEFRWKYVIERSLTFSHFVVASVVISEFPEQVISKWVNIAGELKSSFGNFFAFSSIMRGLLTPQITRTDGNINWLRLRQEFTQATFNFETSFRGAYQGLVKGTECYPPITVIPELFSAALILEAKTEMMPLSCVSAEESELEFYYNHLKELRSLASWSEIQQRNLERHLNECPANDVVLLDMFRTELHLLLLWGDEYPALDLRERCSIMNNFNKTLQ